MQKEKELLVNTLKGVLKSRLSQNRSRAVPSVLLPQNWLSHHLYSRLGPGWWAAG